MSVTLSTKIFEHKIKKTKQIVNTYEENQRRKLTLWQAIILTSIFVNYLITTFSYVFLRNQINAKVYFIILILDLLYIINYLIAVISFFWKNKTIDINFQPTKSKLILTVDFFLAFPYPYIYEAATNESNYNFYIFLSLRAIIMLRLIHQVSFFQRQWNTAGVRPMKYFAIQYVSYLLIRIHTTACVWYLTIFSNEERTKWSKLNDFRAKYQHTSEKYLISFYYALTSFTNRNFGEIVPESTLQKILSVMVISMGFMFTTGLFIGVLSFLLDAKHKRRTNLRFELQNILTYLKTAPNLFKHRKTIKSYYEMLWTKNLGVRKSSQFQLLPTPLKHEISVDTSVGLLQNSTLFRNTPDAFLRVLSNLIKYEFYQMGDFIYYRNIVKTKMIFIVVGTVEILSNEDDESPVIALNPGTCLGESVLVTTCPAKSSVRATCFTELQVLYRKDFLTLIDLFPQIYNNISNNIKGRFANAQYNERHQNKKLKLTPFLPKASTTFIRALKENVDQSKLQSEQKDQYLSLYRIKKTSTKRETICLSEKFPWILQQNSSFTKFWDFCVVLVTLNISVTYPYYLIFLKKYPIWFHFSLHFVDLFLMIDVVLILTTAVEERGKIIKTFTEITQKRLTQFQFYLDFLSSLKIEIFYWIWTNNQRYRDVLRLNRLLKVFRIVTLFKRTENKFDNNLQILYFIKYVFYLLLSAYWFGAIFYLITCFGDYCSEDGWFFSKLLQNRKQQLSVSYTYHEILTSIYFALSCVTGLTPGDILPSNTTDMIVTIFAMTCGICSFCCCVSQSAAFLTRKSKPYNNFQDTLSIITQFMREKNMGKDLIQRVKNYFILQWNYDKASVLRKPILCNLNKDTITKIRIDERLDIISSIPLFEGQNVDFLFSLLAEAKTLVLPPNEFLTYKGETVKILYVIEKGYCIRQFEKSYVVLGPKSYFGTMCVFSNVNSLCTVKTLTHVKLFYISEEVFWKSASLYPTVTSQFKEASANFDIITEFKQIPVSPTVFGIETIEHDNSMLKGSFLNVISHCKQNDEEYSTPFGELGMLRWIQLFLLPICILPYGTFLEVWIILRVLVAAFVVVLVPLQIIQTPSLDAVTAFLFITDIIAYVDLYLMMLVGYYESKNQLVVHPLKTALHYIKGKFVMDLILCFPWEVLTSYFVENTEKEPYLYYYYALIKMVKMGQIYSIFPLFTQLSRNKKPIKSNILQVMKYLPATFIIIHFWATVLIVNSCRIYHSKLSNFSDKTIQKFPSFYCFEDSWIDRSRFQNFTTSYQIYVSSIYYCTGILTLCGFGDITPNYLSTLVIVIIIIISGFLFIGYIYAKISSYKAHWNHLLFKNREMVIELKEFMADENVNEKLSQQVLERIEYGWKRKKGNDPNVILKTLNPVLHQDILFTIFERTLKNVPIFENIDKSFLRIFGNIIKENYYLRQETIYKSDDVISDLCIIERGVVRVISKSGTMEAFIGTGGIFGNITSNKNHKISITVTALSNVDLLVLNSEAFFTALEDYPTIKTTIERTFTRRTDFIIPSFRTSQDVALDAKSYPETTTSLSTFASLIEFKASVLGFCLICLPWKLFRIAIPQYSLLFTFFDVYCLVLTYVGSVILTYEFAFQHHSFYFICCAIYVDFMFVLKILLEMHRTYENHYGEIITSNMKIMEEYFREKKMERILELIINFPHYYVVLIVAIFKTFNTYLVFSSLRMLTIFRLLYFFDYYKKKTNQLMANRVKLKIFATVVWGTLVIHFFACGWYLCACPLTFCVKNSWVTEFGRNNVYDSEKLDIYVTCVYFIITLLTKTGTGDIVASNLQEQIYISVVMISSIFVIGIFIGEIWNFLNSITISRLKYDHTINELRQYVQNNRISQYKLKKMWKYVRKLWSVSKGNQIPRAVSLLHYATFQELMSEIYIHHLKNSYLFSEVEDPFARQVCQYFKRTIYFPGNYIVQHGDINNSMYFIHFGEVDILTVHANLTETIHEVLQNGDMFGVIQGLYQNVPHHFSFRARTTTHIVSLQLSDWEYLLDLFPESKESIFSKTTKVNV